MPAFWSAELRACGRISGHYGARCFGAAVRVAMALVKFFVKFTYYNIAWGEKNC